MAHAAVPRNPLPFLLREPGILLCLFQHRFLNERHLGVCFRRLWKTYRNLIPHPLPDGRKIEVLARHRVIVDEGCAAPGGMSFIGPGTVFKDRGPEKIDLNHLAGDPIDLHPVPHTDSVLAHENEPAEKRHNEALQGDGKARSRQTEDGGYLAGHTERDQQHTDRAQQLHTEPQNRAQGLHPPALQCTALQQRHPCGLDKKRANQNKRNTSQRAHGHVGDDAVLQHHLV